MHFNEYDAEEFAHDALVAWKTKVLKRIDQVRKRATNSKGVALPDAFVGQKLGTKTKRNLIADIGTFVFNQMQSQRKTTAHRAQLVPTDPLASEHEGERGEDERQVGKTASTEVTPASEITGGEFHKEIIRVFKTLVGELRRQGDTDCGGPPRYHPKGG
jgi:hypothetical protein